MDLVALNGMECLAVCQGTSWPEQELSKRIPTPLKTPNLSLFLFSQFVELKIQQGSFIRLPRQLKTFFFKLNVSENLTLFKIIAHYLQHAFLFFQIKKQWTS